MCGFGGIACRFMRFKSALRQGVADCGGSNIMRRTTPWQVAKCTIAYAIKNADKKKGAAQPLRFPPAGRSLNSRGFSNPRCPDPGGYCRIEWLECH